MAFKDIAKQALPALAMGFGGEDFQQGAQIAIMEHQLRQQQTALEGARQYREMQMRQMEETMRRKRESEQAMLGLRREIDPEAFKGEGWGPAAYQRFQAATITGQPAWLPERDMPTAPTPKTKWIKVKNRQTGKLEWKLRREGVPLSPEYEIPESETQRAPQLFETWYTAAIGKFRKRFGRNPNPGEIKRMIEEEYRPFSFQREMFKSIMLGGTELQQELDAIDKELNQLKRK